MLPRRHRSVLGSLVVAAFVRRPRALGLNRSGKRRWGVLFALLVLVALLRLVAVVLEPDLDLGRRQTDTTGQLVSLGRREIALLLESFFEFIDLNLCEENASLASVVHRLKSHRSLRLVEDAE